MDSTVCGNFNTEKSIVYVFNKYRECKQCNNERSLKRYSENKLSNQQKIFYEEIRDKLLQKQNNREMNLKDLLKSYVELENRLNALG